MSGSKAMGMDRMLAFPLPRKTIEENPVPALPEMPPQSGGKIIPFPGVTLDTGVSIHDILDDFLREMGYI